MEENPAEGGSPSSASAEAATVQCTGASDSTDATADSPPSSELNADASSSAPPVHQVGVVATEQTQPDEAEQQGASGKAAAPIIDEQDEPSELTELQQRVLALRTLTDKARLPRVASDETPKVGPTQLTDVCANEAPGDGRDDNRADALNQLNLSSLVKGANELTRAIYPTVLLMADSDLAEASVVAEFEHVTALRDRLWIAELDVDEDESVLKMWKRQADHFDAKRTAEMEQTCEADAYEEANVLCWQLNYDQTADGGLLEALRCCTRRRGRSVQLAIRLELGDEWRVESDVQLDGVDAAVSELARIRAPLDWLVCECIWPAIDSAVGQSPPAA